MYGYIYITTNLINNKIYIGKHASPVFEPNKYIGSGKTLLRAIKKYGIENFKNELLCECLTAEELNEKEQYYISLYNSTNKNIGYNIQCGGEGNTKNSIHIHNKDNKDLYVLQENIDIYLQSGWEIGWSNKYVNGMCGKQQSEYQKAIVSKACSYKRNAEQLKNFSKAKKIPNKFICLRTPDNSSTIRCLIKNKDHYLSLGYILCNNK